MHRRLALLLLATTACGPSYDPEAFTLVGTWAIEDVTKPGEGAATKTKLAFADDGSWELLREGDLCELGLPTEGWFCDGKGDWKLRPDDVLDGDTTTLVITPKGKGADTEKFDAWFVDPDRFCWKRSMLGDECVLRQ